MNNESGRSLIEMLGVLAIMGVLTTAVIAAYNTLRDRTSRTIAEESLKTTAQNAEILFSSRGNYTGISVDYLIKAGELKDVRPPLGGMDWTITSNGLGDEFSINLVNLSADDCKYFVLKKLDWATAILVNGVETVQGAESSCLSTGDNDLSIVVK